MKSLLVQSYVALGVWWALLVDLLGNFDGQDQPPEFIPIINGCAISLVVAHTVIGARCFRRYRDLRS